MAAMNVLLCLLSIILSLHLTTATVFAEDCPCFSREELDVFTAANIDTVHSCRESHSTGSGISIAMKQTEEEDLLHAAFTYAVNLDQKECVVQGDMIIDVPTTEMAETCAEFIRKRCDATGIKRIEF